jgi:hypothetical protein
MRQSNSRKSAGLPDQLWSQHREAALNWLAFGLLLAAWNAADDGEPATSRPQVLRGYSQVSVRAVERNYGDDLAAEEFFSNSHKIVN